ncbi:MAG TPA: tetratricopeptide repeat protein [Ignavibacteriaceae bacterium]|nr:tetratricopeptide repeat protein [Ignavibacteriaceae bacterium]
MKSIVLLILAGLIITGCGRKSEQEFMTAAEKSIKENNYQKAIKSYNELINEYPDGKETATAMVKLAGIYQNKQDSTLNPVKCYQKAVETFKTVYERFPESKEGPTSLFMSGFIEANDLNNFDAATKTYQLFLQKYPNHELAKSAQEELNNMGMAPEEILKKKDAKSI